VSLPGSNVRKDFAHSLTTTLRAAPSLNSPRTSSPAATTVIDATVIDVAPSPPAPSHAIRGWFELVPSALEPGSTELTVFSSIAVPAPAPACAAPASPAPQGLASMLGSMSTPSTPKNIMNQISAGATTVLGSVRRSSASSTAGAPSQQQAELILEDFQSLLPTVFKLFDRSADVDEAVLSALAGQFAADDAPPPTETEEGLGRAGLALLEEERVWGRVPGTVRDAVDSFHALGPDKTVWCKGTASVDAPAARALAYVRERKEEVRDALN
jgi:hypothetical protein